MENALAEGISQLVQLSPVVAVLCIVCAAQSFLIWTLLKDAKEERGINRGVIDRNNNVLSTLTEVIRAK